jgi:hypothetical protein
VKLIELTISADGRNVGEILSYETSLKDSLNEANALGDNPVYPVAVRSRYCGCPYNALTDCRFHARTETGWEVCPSTESSTQIGTMKRGRWLYVTTGEPVNQDDPTEAQDNALAERLSKELIKAVQ